MLTAQDRIKWLPIMNAVLKLGFHESREFLDPLRNSKLFKTLHHGGVVVVVIIISS